MKKPKPQYYDTHGGVAMIRNWIDTLKKKTGRDLDEWTTFIKTKGPKVSAVKSTASAQTLPGGLPATPMVNTTRGRAPWRVQTSSACPQTPVPARFRSANISRPADTADGHLEVLLRQRTDVIPLESVTTSASIAVFGPPLGER